MDNSMDNYNMAMLSMEPKNGSSPFTAITVSPLIQSAVGILLDSRNAAATKKPNIACVTIILK